jgi:hypothetical protein
MTVLRAVATGMPGDHVIARMRSAPLEEFIQRSAHVPVQPALLDRVERPARSSRVDPGAPEHLVGQKVSDPGDL